MNSIANIKPTETKLRSERACIISEFVKEINFDRQGTSYFPTTGKVIAIKTSHLSLKDLRDFYKDCWRYKIEGKGEFSKCFFGALKIR